MYSTGAPANLRKNAKLREWGAISSLLFHHRYVAQMPQLPPVVQAIADEELIGGGREPNKVRTRRDSVAAALFDQGAGADLATALRTQNLARRDQRPSRLDHGVDHDDLPPGHILGRCANKLNRAAGTARPVAG